MSSGGPHGKLASPTAARHGVAAEPLHPVLRRLFAQLERAGVHWLLLRVPSAPAAPTGDVDILVSRTDAVALRGVALSLGFVAVPGWDAAPELILVFYDHGSDRWLPLDVSTEVSFDVAPAMLNREATEAILRRRQLCSGTALPTDGDAFWLLLLHCLLEKGCIAAHYRHRLRSLAPAALDSPLASALKVASGGRFAPNALVSMVRVEAWDALTDLAPSLVAELRRRTPTRHRLRRRADKLVATARKPLLVRRRRGLNVALLGPNGVGKSTAAAGLQRSFPFESRVLYMGVWKAASSPRGRLRGTAEIVTRPARIWARYLHAEYHRLRGRLVVFDRYVYEALLPAKPPLLTLKRAYFWLLAHLIPEPSALVVLDVAGHIAYGRKQENPPDELESERRLYASLATRVPSLMLVDAAADADSVRAQISSIIWRELSARWRACGGDS